MKWPHAENFRCLVLICFFFAGSGSVAAIAGNYDPDTPVTMKLGPLPQLQMEQKPPFGDNQIRRVKELIGKLQTMDQMELGLSKDQDGDQFSPIGSSGRLSSFAIPVKPHSSPEVAELVRLGPAALPSLLDALDDQRPTKIVVTHDGTIGQMHFVRELDLNPANPSEVAITKTHKDVSTTRPAHLRSYTLKVGDVCFVIVGQIVGRRYRAVRYEPTANIILNCTAQDPDLCAEVRAIWSSRDPYSTLFKSLLVDYATEATFNGISLDGWDAGNDLKCSAAMRLLFYFEKESATFLAGRLDALDVSRTADIDANIRQCVANGVCADNLAQSLSWSKCDLVRGALLRLFNRSENVRVCLAAIPFDLDDRGFADRMARLICMLPAAETTTSGDGLLILETIAFRAPRNANSLILRYLSNASVQRCHTACIAMRIVNLPGQVDVLGVLLQDRREVDALRAIKIGHESFSIRVRVCDEAAVTLSLLDAAFQFEVSNDRNRMDVQIAIIRHQIARRNEHMVN